MSQAQALYRLQKLDLDLDSRRARAHEIMAALDQDGALRQARAAVRALEDKLTPQETHLTDLNLEIKSVVEQTQQLNQRLYGGAVTNPKELQDIEEKIAERERRREVLEDQVLETMLTLDELRAVLGTASDQLREVNASHTAGHEALSQELAQIKREIKQLKAARATLAPEINPDNLALYQELRTKKAGHAVAMLMNGSCSVCGVSQTTTLTQRARQDLGMVFCASCGRILVMM